MFDVMNAWVRYGNIPLFFPLLRGVKGGEILQGKKLGSLYVVPTPLDTKRWSGVHLLLKITLGSPTLTILGIGVWAG